MTLLQMVESAQQAINGPAIPPPRQPVGDDIAYMMQFYPEFEAFIEGIATAYFDAQREPAPYPFEDVDYRSGHAK